MKKAKTIGVMVTAMLSVAAMAACSSGGAAGGDNSGGDKGAVKTTVLKVAFNQPDTHPEYVALEHFGEKLKEATDGAYEIKIFPNELLGAQQETITGVESGSIDMSVVVGSLLENVNPDFVAFNLPYVFDSQDQQMAVLADPEVTGDLYTSMEDKNMTVVAGFTGGTRNVYNSKKPIETPTDLDGMKLRVIQNDTMVEMMNLMGGAGTPMGQGDVYTAIQSGVLAGAENNELIYNSLKHDEVAPYYSYTRHLMIPDYLVINTGVLNGMTAEQKKAFTEGLTAASTEEAQLWDKDIAKAKAASEAAGAKFNEPDTAPFKKAVAPLIEKKLASSPTAQKLYDAVQNHS